MTSHNSIVPDKLDLVYASLKEAERRGRQLVAILAIVLMMLAVSSGGWYYTSRDQTNTKRNGHVADCRSAELAKTLDGFQIIVSPSATADERDEAAKVLDDLQTLEARYADCIIKFD